MMGFGMYGLPRVGEIFLDLFEEQVSFLKMPDCQVNLISDCNVPHTRVCDMSPLRHHRNTSRKLSF